jgi:hypothetical protein
MKSLDDILAKRKTTDEQKDSLFAQVQSAKNKCDGNRTLYIQRFNESYDYYNAKKPAATYINSSSYGQGESDKRQAETVIPVLYNSVKAGVSGLIATFTEDDSLACSFRNRGFRKNPAIESLVDYNINKIFLREQDGYHILENMIREILVTGDGFGKVYIQETEHRDSFTLEDWVEVSELLAELTDGWTIETPKVFDKKTEGKFKGFEWKEEEETVTDPQTGQPTKQQSLFVKGKIPLIQREKKVKIEHVDSSDIWIDTSAGHDFNRCPYICHRIRTTVGEAVAMGFDKDKLLNANKETNDQKRGEFSFSNAFYQNPLMGGSGFDNFDDEDSVDPMNRKIDIYEHYIKSSLLNKDGDDEVKRYQVTATNNELLRVVEIKRFPFAHGQCETVVGSCFGRSFFDIAKPFQDQISIITRLSMQDAKLSIHPRWIATKQGYDRQSIMQSLMEPGTVIEETQPNSLRNVPRDSSAQNFLAILQGLKEDAVEALVQPIDIASSNGGMPQAAASAIALKVYQDAQKGKALSKNIARTLIKPLISLIYEIIKDENFELETPEGQVIEGMQLPNLYDFIVDVNTVNDDFAQYMQLSNVSNLMMQLAQVPNSVVTPQNQYEIAKFAYESFGLDYDRFITNPAEQQQNAAAEQQAAKAEEMDSLNVELAKVKLRSEAAKVFKLEQETEEMIRSGTSERKLKPQEVQAAIQKIISDAQSKADANSVKASEVAMKQDLGNKEFILAANQHAHDIASARVNGVR